MCDVPEDELPVLDEEVSAIREVALEEDGIHALLDPDPEDMELGGDEDGGRKEEGIAGPDEDLTLASDDEWDCPILDEVVPASWPPVSGSSPPGSRGRQPARINHAGRRTRRADM